MAEFLWSKNPNDSGPDESIQAFTRGDDLILDQRLLPFDTRATIAHVRGLQRIGILTADECSQLIAALDRLFSAVQKNEWRLQPPHEDGHSAIEFWLHQELGEVGKKVHTGRSRNDQVQVAMRLYLLDRLSQLQQLAVQIAEVMLQRAEESELTPLPGYTHLQRAVPSTLEMWFAAFAESFIDIAWLSQMTEQWIDASPLGTAAGYGVNLPLDRQGVADELGFARLQVNPIYVQNSRGRFEIQVLTCIAQATLEMRRFAWDVSLFCCDELGFMRVADRHSTGSSIMPNKRNPDVIELLRAQHAVVQGSLSELQSALSLPSGYQRDLQVTKGATMRGVEGSLSALQLLPDVVRGLSFDRKRMLQSISPDTMATDVVIDRVKSGLPFRDAYRAAPTAEELAARTAEQSVRDRVSPGACARLELATLRQRLEQVSRTRAPDPK